MSALIGGIGSLMRSGGGGASDPLWANVSSLLRFDGDDGSTSFPDLKGVVWTPAGNAKITSEQTAAGSGSLLLGGSSDRIASLSVPAFGFGAGDFTAECFFRPTVVQYGNRFIFDARVVGGASWMLWCAQTNAPHQLGWSTEGGTSFVAGGSFSVEAWNHVALSRAGGTVRGFVGGALAFTVADARDYGSSQGIQIGSSSAPNQGAIGCIDEVRITKGVARYTAPFAPPLPPFPAG